MPIARYLPSTQFAVMAGALLLSGGLVFAAQYVTTAHSAESALATTNTADTQNTDWQSALEAVAATSGTTPPSTISSDQVSQLVSEISNSNLTDTVGKSLLINLSAAAAQGLDDDATTQNQIIAQAVAQAATSTPSAYTATDLTVTSDSKNALTTYGNAVMTALAAHTKANSGNVFMAVGYATDYQDASRLAPLKTACPDYSALAGDLAAVPVPQSLVPLYLEAKNDTDAMGAACADLQYVISDPLRGLTALQQFETLDDEATRVFTSIAKEFNTDGILFTKDEPGSAWSAFSDASAQ
jgi:hypothetical protein